MALPFCQTSVLSRGQGSGFSNGSLQSPRVAPALLPSLSTSGVARTRCPVTSSASSGTGHPRPGQELLSAEGGSPGQGGLAELRALSSRSFPSPLRTAGAGSARRHWLALGGVTASFRALLVGAPTSAARGGAHRLLLAPAPRPPPRQRAGSSRVPRARRVARAQRRGDSGRGRASNSGAGPGQRQEEAEPAGAGARREERSPRGRGRAGAMGRVNGGAGS